MTMTLRTPLLVALLTLTACAGESSEPETSGPATAQLDGAAERYVRLVLAAGRHDADLVDAYYGPAAWATEAKAGEPVPLPDLRRRLGALQDEVRKAHPSDRRSFLDRQLTAIDARLRIQAGEALPLAEEARLLYGIALPSSAAPALEKARAELDALLPGPGSLSGRVEAFRSRFHVDPRKLNDLIRPTLVQIRGRTDALVPLPDREGIAVRQVDKKPWGAYCWYKGGLKSLLEINIEQPIEVGAVLNILAHESYPGHHTTNILQESEMVRGRGRFELTVQPLFSPQALAMEGTADAGLDVLMTRDEQDAFLREVLAPVAGLSDRDFDLYRRVREASEALRGVRGEAARMLLLEARPEDEVVRFLVDTGLQTEERARRGVDFLRRYRAYVFTYTVGGDLVRAYIGDGPDRAQRFAALLRTPLLPEA